MLGVHLSFPGKLRLDYGENLRKRNGAVRGSRPGPLLITQVDVPTRLRAQPVPRQLEAKHFGGMIERCH